MFFFTSRIRLKPVPSSLVPSFPRSPLVPATFRFDKYICGGGGGADLIFENVSCKERRKLCVFWEGIYLSRLVDLGHHANLGFLGYLGCLRHGYHSSMFTFVSTVSMITLATPVAFVTMVTMFTLAEMTYGTQLRG
jgi:hypothetical protein